MLNNDLTAISFPPHQREQEDQQKLFAWASANLEQYPALICFFAIVNVGWRFVSHRFRRAGLRPGVPDLCLPVPRGIHHGLFIELKQPGKEPTEEQIEWILRLRRYGYKAQVCFSFQEARDTILAYLNLPPQRPIYAPVFVRSKPARSKPHPPQKLAP